MDKMLVKENDSLKRDSHSKAIINVNKNSYYQYKMIKKRKDESAQQMYQIESLTNEVNFLKDEISEIKNLLVQLVDK